MRLTTRMALSVLTGLVSLIILNTCHQVRSSTRELGSRYFGLSPARTSDGRAIEPERLGGSDYCGNCHRQIFHEWNSSLHHFSSFNNAVYRTVALDVVKRRGGANLAFCAGCHDPVALLGGEIPPQSLNAWSANAGITCLACHRISAIHGINGGYTITAPALNATLLTDIPWLQPLHRAGLTIAPSLHRRSLSRPFYESPEYCAACHTLRSPAALNGHGSLTLQDERGEAPQGSSCIDCHMPLVPSSDPAATAGRARSHRFAGGNTAVPYWNRDQAQFDATERFLKSAIRIRHSAVEIENATIELRYEIRNTGVGHSFPAGTTDSNEAWAELEVTDARGAVVFREDRAATFRTVFIDRHGRPTDRRTTATEAIAVRSSTLLAPGEIRPVRLRFAAPSQSAFPLTATFSVKWRKYPPSLVDWLNSAQTPRSQAPVTELDSNVTILSSLSQRP
jgi:hypothetical protein